MTDKRTWTERIASEPSQTEAFITGMLFQLLCFIVSFWIFS